MKRFQVNQAQKSCRSNKACLELSTCVAVGGGNLAAPKPAFTLAEVLITLGIIGIVAAMTMPSLIQNHQKRLTAERLKKMYTTLRTAIDLAELDNGERENWSFATD